MKRKVLLVLSDLLIASVAIALIACGGGKGGKTSNKLEILIPSKRCPEGVYQHFGRTRRIMDGGGLPVVGAGYSYLREGGTDLVGLGRQAIADPATPVKALRGEACSIDWCFACGGCGALLGDQKKVGCIVYDKRYK